MGSVDGVIKPGEATGAALKFCRRQNGFNWPLYGWIGLVVLVGLLVGGAYDIGVDRLGWPHGYDGAACLVTYIIGLFLLRPIYLRVATTRFRRRRTALGLPEQLPFHAHVSAKAFHCDFGGSRSEVDWELVTEVLAIGRYWVVSANSNPFYVPRRFFADQAAEKAFIADLLQRMTPEARARSKGAVGFCQAA